MLDSQRHHQAPCESGGDGASKTDTVAQSLSESTQTSPPPRTIFPRRWNSPTNEKSQFGPMGMLRETVALPRCAELYRSRCSLTTLRRGPIGCGQFAAPQIHEWKSEESETSPHRILGVGARIEFTVMS